MQRTPESGFTLIELAVVVLITGLLMGGSFSLMKPYLQTAHRNGTRERLENISQTLALYAQTYGRLPCPAPPDDATVAFGFPRQSVNGTVTTASCGGSINDYRGIVPFRVLGIDEDQAKDAYGNFITYAVSRVMAGDDNTKVHAQCRTAKWLSTTAPVTNLNVNKAMLCCPNASAAANEVIIRNTRNGGSTSLVYTGLHGATEYQLPNVLNATPPNADTHLIAYALVSHGENGDGAYIGRSANTRTVTTATGTTPQESENRDTGNLEFVSRQLSTKDDDNYFDDIVLWKTNDQLVNAFGNDSCVRP